MFTVHKNNLNFFAYEGRKLKACWSCSHVASILSRIYQVIDFECPPELNVLKLRRIYNSNLAYGDGRKLKACWIYGVAHMLPVFYLVYIRS